MVPYYHEETYFYLDGTKEVADEYDAFVFMTELEKKFATEQLNIESKTSIVLGSGIENESSLEKYDSCNNKVEVDLNAPFVLYVGRLEPAKGVGQLVENFINYKKENPGPLKLFLIGKKDVHLNIPIHMDIVELGFVSESVKMATISNALALINPSEFESLSLVLLESWALKTPVIVNENCSVMREQCRKSNGGLFYSNSREFKLVLDFALNNPVKMKSIGLQGYDFYIKNYRWKHITNKLIQFVDDQIALHS
jgi:glycosyltransferase involved in cell wall biosynthesis